MTTDLLSLPFEFPIQHSQSSDSSISYDSLPASDPLVVYPGDERSDVQLEVSGQSFVLSSRDFQKLGSLQWKRIHGSAYRLEDGSPEAFEHVMDYVLYAQGRQELLTSTRTGSTCL